jgi:hypothetical protein
MNLEGGYVDPLYWYHLRSALDLEFEYLTFQEMLGILVKELEDVKFFYA